MKRVDRAITRQLKEEKRQRKRDKIDRQRTVLILGSRGSGKTTLIKQLKIMLHDEHRKRQRPRGSHNEEISEEPFSEEEKKMYASSVYKNVFTAIKEFVLAMRKLSIQYEDPANEELWERFANIDPSTVNELSSEFCSLIKQLWNDNGVKECYERREEFNFIPGSAKYFLDALDRISSKGYSPTTDDILKVYEPTTDTVSHHMPGMRIVEIGNQSIERPKNWIQLFNRVCIIYLVVDVSKYDVTVEPSQTITNQLEASKLLLENLCQIYVCPKPTVVLCFTKKDIFNEKIYQSDLVDHLPAYTGPKQDPEAAMTFISDMFMKSTRDSRMAVRVIKISTTSVYSTQAAVRSSFQEGIVRFYLSEVDLL